MAYTFGERAEFQNETIQWDKLKLKYHCYCCNKYITKIYEHMQLETHTDNLERMKNKYDD
jgi:hypothetical protein